MHIILSCPLWYFIYTSHSHRALASAALLLGTGKALLWMRKDPRTSTTMASTAVFEAVPVEDDKEAEREDDEKEDEAEADATADADDDVGASASGKKRGRPKVRPGA